MHIDRLKLQRVGKTRTGSLFHGTFRAQESGELILFANDIATPLPMCTFYAKGKGANTGSAQVLVYDATAGERTVLELIKGAKPVVKVAGPGLHCA